LEINLGPREEIQMKVKSPATLEDLMKMPKDGYKYELVDGAIVASPTGMYHSEVGARISHILQKFLDETPLGRIYGSDVGIQLPDGNLRSPDSCFVSAGKLPGGKSPVTFGELVPDLVVEVLSPGDSAREVADKIGEYLECGVPLVWLVDPKAKTVTVYRTLTDARRLSSEDILTAEPVLPGFSCRVSQFF
jgi:Uma2 family endonuclease